MYKHYIQVALTKIAAMPIYTVKTRLHVLFFCLVTVHADSQVSIVAFWVTYCVEYSKLKLRDINIRGQLFKINDVLS